jgi:signal transduction histidine kinase/AmiR/NasT family two-component response regulator
MSEIPTPAQDVASDSPTVELDDRLRARLRGIQASTVLAHTSTASLISSVAALVLAMYLAPDVGRVLAYSWLALKLAAAMPRFLLAQAHRRKLWRPTDLRLSTVLLVSLVIDGAIWGVAGVWGSRQDNSTAAFLFAWLSSVAMLSTFGLQIQQRATAAFVLPIMVPLGLAFLARGDTLGFGASVGALLVVVQALVTGFASEKRVTREFLAHESVEKALAQRSAALALASSTAETLERALVDVQRQSAVKTVFLGTMSHELRTPLHAILGLTEIIQRQVTDPKTKQHLGLIESSGNHLLSLIGALLDVARIDAGKLTLAPAPFNLAVELRDLAEIYALRADAKGIGFQFSSEVDDPCWVHGDAARLRQVLHNLLGNAIKFTRRGLVRLTITQSHARFVFQVADTGGGIAADDLPHIFEAFRQVKETAARPSEGTGLGLTIAREIAQAMGGDITVSSALNVGSRFEFSARMDRVAQDLIPAKVRQRDTPPPRLRSSFKVLLVEDNDVNAMIAQAHLDRLGVHTIRAYNGREAVHLAMDGSRPDLILMDSRMPIMEGPEASRLIREAERSAGLPRVPIIAVTANPGDDDQAECFEAGMDGFLMKPFTDAQFLQAVKGYIVRGQEQMMQHHPLYDLAMALEDSPEPDLAGFGSITVH